MRHSIAIIFQMNERIFSMYKKNRWSKLKLMSVFA